MIAQRRPAMDDTYLPFTGFPADYYHKSMEFMKKRGRKPQLAYVFEAWPALQPVSLENPARFWQSKRFSFPSGDPISQYVIANMTLIESFPISTELSVRCFIDNASALSILENKLKTDPANPELNLLIWNIYQKQGDFDKARRYYKKVSIPH
jgi:hypothetical protein